MKITLISSDIDLEEIERVRKEATKEGHDVDVVDFSEFHYSYVDEKISFNPEIKDTDLVIVRGLFSAMRSVEPLSEYIKSRGIKFFDNNLFKHKYSINKVFDITKLIFSGVPTPDFYHARNYKALYDYADAMKYPAIIKSAGTGKGASIYKMGSRGELIKMLNDWEKEGYKARKIVIQNYVDYKYDLRVLVIGEEMFAMRRIPKSGDFRANFSLGGSIELFELTSEIKALARKATEAIGLKVAGVDVLIDQAGKMCILEVNHTPGFIGMEKATGKNIGNIYLKYAISNSRTSER